MRGGKRALRSAVQTVLDAAPTVQAEALPLLHSVDLKTSLWWIVQEAIESLLQQELPLTEETLVEVLGWRSYFDPYGLILGALERYLETNASTPALRIAIAGFRVAAVDFTESKKKYGWDARIAHILGDELDGVPRVHLDHDQPWAERLAIDLDSLEAPHGGSMMRLLAHALQADGGRPSAKWQERSREILESSPPDLLRSALCVWLTAFGSPSTTLGETARSEWTVPGINADAMKGLLWMTPGLADDDIVRAVVDVGLSSQRKIRGVGPRSPRVTNAAIWALGNIDRELAIGQLAILRSRIRNKSVQNQIDKAMASVAERLGVSEAEVEELAVPTFGLSDVGALDVPLGEFTAELRVTGTGSTSIGWRKPDGKVQKSVPKAVKEEHADELKGLKANAKDIQKLLPAQRDRIDMLHLGQRSWTVPTWRARYLDHVLVGTLARRLIWVVTDADGGRRRTVCWADGALVGRDGAQVDVDETTDHVSLWHPIGRPEEEVQEWRTFFEEREVVQPFKQAHREVYVLTDAERATHVYSNRFAAHILKQHQFNALCATRGWRNVLRLAVDDSYQPATLDLPEWNLRAEFWIESVGEELSESGTYSYLATDQVRFYERGAAQVRAHAGGGGYGSAYGESAAEPIPVDRIDPLVFSEVMRDVDLFVGVSSVGNDPAWQDGGGDVERETYWQSYSFGELSATATTRKELLERLVPRLKIADCCSFQDRFLVVRGDRRTYRIHLGSGNILMEPNDQYLCIVPGRGAITGPATKVFLPFEGDRTLSIILSKAFLLAEDRKITDPTILSQIE